MEEFCVNFDKILQNDHMSFFSLLVFQADGEGERHVALFCRETGCIPSSILTRICAKVSIESALFQKMQEELF